MAYNPNPHDENYHYDYNPPQQQQQQPQQSQHVRFSYPNTPPPPPQIPPPPQGGGGGGYGPYSHTPPPLPPMPPTSPPVGGGGGYNDPFADGGRPQSAYDPYAPADYTRGRATSNPPNPNPYDYRQSPAPIIPPASHSPPIPMQDYRSTPLSFQQPDVLPSPATSHTVYQMEETYYPPGGGPAGEDGGQPLLRHRGGSLGAGGGGGGMPGYYDNTPSNENGPEEESNIRYGRIPQRVPRRYRTIKKVELFHGNYVYDAAVPTKLLAMCGNRTEREFTHLRYTCATCDPNDFMEEGYTLRQVLYDPPRRTELFIVMTMYNEDEILFSRTMHGVLKNIAHLCTRERSKTWGKEGWKKVVVCIVSDGRAKIASRTLSVIAAMGAYQDGIAKSIVNGKDVKAHIYEYTTQVSITPSLRIEGSERGTVPVQLIFCLKEKNQKKINSHRWFFNAFGPVLQPNVCVLLDVGTQPGPTSIYHLWKAFDINSNVGGACGEIVAEKGKFWLNLLNPLVAAQNFEYKMSNILDKPLESVFGYITVLPGAFSAYRYIALQNDSQGEGPLQKYFLGEKMHGADADIFTANMYLAEDRILCWELVSKRGGSWILHYVKSAYAITDVPDQVPELISQRRRWLNGSFFAAIHGTVKFGYIYRSSHSFWRKFWIHVELVYQVFNLIFSWFALGNYYIAFVVLAESMEGFAPGFHIPNDIMRYVYLGLVVMCFILSLGNRPQGSKWPYTTAMIGFGFITLYMTFAAFFLAIKGAQELAAEKANHTLSFADVFAEPKFGQIVLSIVATLGLYIIASLLFFDPWHMITSFAQYLLLAPSYIAVLNVYAFSNVHDISWGTKGDNKIATDLGAVATTKKEGDKHMVDSEVPTDEKDINAAYDDALHVLATPPPKVEAKEDEKTKQEDYYKSFRTNVLLAWTLSNGLLAAVITAATIDTVHQEAARIYTAFILYSVAFLAFIRFIGSTTYMLIRLFAGE